MKFPRSSLLLCLFILAAESGAQDKRHLEIESEFGSFVEDDFPFFCQTLDAREFGENPESTNLAPRGIVIRLGHGYWGCFDPDLLRWALIWKENEKGEYLTMDGMAPGSYRLPNRKAPSGQESLPKPIGTPIAATPALPGWWPGEEPVDSDPREKGSSDEGEIGLGPMPAEKGRFEGIRLTAEGVQLVYRVGDSRIEELVLSPDPKGDAFDLSRIEIEGDSRIWRRKLMPGKTEETRWQSLEHGGLGRLALGDPESRGDELKLSSGLAPDPGEATALWKEMVTTKAQPSPAEGAFVFDDIPLPVPNPWERNVRLVGLDFFPNGRAAFCTFDGDVWLVDGLARGSDSVMWKRFASGLHEPKSVCVVDGQIYVSDRNGIVRLQDTDGNGEADWYENFSNIVPQTAETREFAMDMVAAPGGGFYLAKGGQVGDTRGIANGTIVKVSGDGRSYDVIATGLRQPYIGFDPETGILTSSDQQGNWKPATPIYRIERGKYYGFQPEQFKEKTVHPAPIDPPEVWIPHFINQSGASQVWMKGHAGGEAEMGALNGCLVHIGYNRPELFRIYLDEKRNQGAAYPFLSGFPAGIIKGRMNPVDGLLYLAGFEIWGTSGERVSGLFRVRPTSEKSWIPRAIEATERGVLLTFDHELDPHLAAELGRYSVDRWNYEQTYNYGSGNFKLDGEPGQESVPLSSATVSKDRKSLFLGLPDMRPSHSLRVTYRIPATDSVQVDSAYLSVWELERIDLTSRGFESDEVDLTPKLLAGAGESIEPTAELGKEVALRYGCIACHATGEGSLPVPVTPAAEGAQVAVGPAWTGLWASHRTFSDGSFIKSVDETYLRESILDPGRRVAEGFEMGKTGVGMPSYLGVLKDHEIESIILYIQTLGKAKKKEKKKK